MQGANLERARRIAFYLTQRHRRSTAEYRYRLMLEYDILREMLRVSGVYCRLEGPHPAKTARMSEGVG